MECSLTWKSFGYEADTVVDREIRSYRPTIVDHGFVPRVNDLHIERDSGPVWSLVIDASALVVNLSAVTGCILLLNFRRNRWAELIEVLAGIVALAGLIYWGVP